MRTQVTLPSPEVRRRMMQARSTPRAIALHPVAGLPASTVNHDDEQASRPTLLEVCWPALLGFLLAIIAEHLRIKVLNDWGLVGDRLVFPWVQFAARPELGMGDPETLSKMALQLQFPLTGLYGTWCLKRGQRLSTTIVQVAFVYLLAAFVLWFLSMPGASHGL